MWKAFSMAEIMPPRGYFSVLDGTYPASFRTFCKNVVKHNGQRVCPDDVYVSKHSVYTIKGFANTIGSQSKNRISSKLQTKTSFFND